MFRRIADTATKSRDGQRVESINLRFSERISLLIGRDHLRRSTDRIALVEHDVGERNGQVANSRAVNDIAIIENRGNPRFKFIDENVVVVRVVVDDAEA